MEKVVAGHAIGFRIKLSGILDSIVDEHTMVVSLLATIYFLSIANIWIIEYTLDYSL